MTDHEKDKRDQLEVSWVRIISFLLALFAGGYMLLENRKLDKAVFEQHVKMMESMADDIRFIREHHR